MNRFVLSTLLAIVLIGCVAEAAKEREKCTRRFCFKVFGKSGKIRITRGTKQKDDDNSITFELDAIKEVDEDNNEVGANLPKERKHSLQTFANTDFEFSVDRDATVLGVKAATFRFSAFIPGPNATVAVQMYLLKEDKDITLCNGENVTVKQGTLKFNIEVENWTFCKDGSCGKGSKDGKRVDLRVLTKPPKGKKAGERAKDSKNKLKPKLKKLGIDGGASMTFPTSAKVDGICTSLAGDVGFEKQGAKFLTTLRFQKFNRTILYDPIVGDDEADSAASTATLSMLVAFFAVLVKFLA